MGLEKVESSVELAEVLGIGLLMLYAYNKLKAPVSSAVAAVKNSQLGQDVTQALTTDPEVTGTAPFVGSVATPGKALTPLQADSVAKFIGPDLHGGGWNLSPDGTQIWFSDGSFYDNTTGHYFSSAGQDLGDLLGGGPIGGQVTTDPTVSTGGGGAF
jgi:hypothetical protein